MKCPHCEHKTNVLQTFAYDDYIVRVRGHRAGECRTRVKTIGRFDTYKPANLIEGAQATALELNAIINQLLDFDTRLKRALGLNQLVHLLDTDNNEKPLFLSSE